MDNRFLFFVGVLDYLQFTTFTLRLCFSHEKQHFVRLFTETSFASAHSCKNPQTTLPLRKTWHLVIVSCSFAFNGTTVFLFVSLNLLQRKDLRPQLTRARQSHPVLGFCFSLRCHSLHFAHAKLSFVQLRATSTFCSLTLNFSLRKIRNTVVKTHNGDNTLRAGVNDRVCRCYNTCVTYLRA